jgi:hypothetical protein
MKAAKDARVARIQAALHQPIATPFQPERRKEKRANKFTVVLSSGEACRLEALAHHESRSMAGMLRAIIDREYERFMKG